MHNDKAQAILAWKIALVPLSAMAFLVLVAWDAATPISTAASKKELIVIKMSPDEAYLQCGSLCGELWGIPVLQIYSRWHQIAGPLVKDKGDWLHCTQRHEVRASRSLEGEVPERYEITVLVLECDGKLRVFELKDVLFR